MQIRQRDSRILHDSQEGSAKSTTDFLDMLQFAQAAELSEEEYTAGEAALCRHQQHRLRALVDVVD